MLLFNFIKVPYVSLEIKYLIFNLKYLLPGAFICYLIKKKSRDLNTTKQALKSLLKIIKFCNVLLTLRHSNRILLHFKFRFSILQANLATNSLDNLQDLKKTNFACVNKSKYYALRTCFYYSVIESIITLV